MTRILHISDLHAHSDSMTRIENLVTNYPIADVVAVTGDCVTYSYQRCPQTWTKWPQNLKLSVPGNHDCSDTFGELHNWRHSTPWSVHFQNLLFIGIEWSEQDKNFIDQTKAYLGTISTNIWLNASAVIILCHCPPNEHLLNIFLPYTRLRKLLFLYGHDHRTGFSGAVWDDSYLVGKTHIYRSHICSSFYPNYGLCHYIEFKSGTFYCSQIQGPDKSPTIEHTKFGRGVVLSTEASGNGSNLTIDFLFHGRKKIKSDYVKWL